MPKRGKNVLTPSSFGQLANNMLNMCRYSWQWYEMMAASAMTISMRLTDINKDLQRNRLPKQKELERMITEKNDAFVKSAFALADWQSAILKSGHSAWPTVSPNSLASSGMDTWTKLFATNIEIGGTMLKGLSGVLQPYHSASTANAFRLSGVRRKR